MKTIENNIKLLKLLLIIEIIIGLSISIIMAIFLGVMATDSPSSTKLDVLIGSVIGFSLVAIPSVLFPTLSIRELNKFPTRKKLTFNIINSIITFFIFFPIAIIQFYIFNSLKNKNITNHST